jgi:hypothetical protein
MQTTVKASIVSSYFSCAAVIKPDEEAITKFYLLFY